MAELQVIAYAHNGFTDKFGIPRQSREESGIETRIVFEPAFRHPDAIRGIEGFDYLWLIWGFNQVPEFNDCQFDRRSTVGKLTVRPPRLGGNKRMGVFATRSPFRPNHLGLSSVRLLRVEQTAKEGTVLVVSGADMLDGTPIYDIKPYLSFSDSHPDARNGFAEESKDYHLQVIWRTRAGLPPQIQSAIEEIVSQDPRPAYQDDNRIYKMDYQGYNIAFRVQDQAVYIEKIEQKE
ncbi:MAG: tRNA (N6-threonylcarbamoyladenosine(37)-N6)-methyltransferase TrmO [Paludibacteraceae bacterium]|nr:tRNA (N6-threonylcarbamoyladenosine(37)-N6)-methyltransferase TrmO [Paludibacteraceae bacterium]